MAVTISATVLRANGTQTAMQKPKSRSIETERNNITTFKKFSERNLIRNISEKESVYRSGCTCHRSTGHGAFCKAAESDVGINQSNQSIDRLSEPRRPLSSTSATYRRIYDNDRGKCSQESSWLHMWFVPLSNLKTGSD
jgi:hypothetical protein